MDMTITTEIFQQLGGSRFVAMTGAKDFIALDETTLRFKIGKNKTKANFVTISLDGTDTYTMKFETVRANSYKKILETGEVNTRKTVSEQEGLYFDMLQSHFTEVTGLYTRLF